MHYKLLFLALTLSFTISGCTSSMATAIGGPLAGAAIQHNNEHYEEK
jgi:outer membrane lipoprotein-sorting protein